MGTRTHWSMERNLNHLKIVVIGSGNVATHLAQALSFSVNIVQIYSRNITNAIALAQKVKGCHAIDNFNDIDTNADIYLISAKDDAIKSIVAQTACRCNSNALWLHTSGSVPADVFAPHCQHYGVLYPLQTFSKDVEVNVAEVPFFVEGNNADTENDIFLIAKSLSATVKRADSDCRRRIHAAAVFACNFTNHMWAIANDILQQGNLEWEILIPLLKETLAKTQELPPAEAQTGPARRGDTDTMNAHIAMLDEHQQEIYRMLSDSIMKRYKQ